MDSSKISPWFLIALMLYFPGAQAWVGELEVGYSMFPESAVWLSQSDNNVSLAAEFEFTKRWNRRHDELVFVPFMRLDKQDSERSHIDIRELLWRHTAHPYELRIGIGKEFWGATEFFHLVDAINQTDFIESVNGEHKLGQPMVAAAYQNNANRFEIWLLPWFRERTFSGDDGRFQLVPGLNTGDALYESGREQRHRDYALRWSTVLEGMDLAVAHFEGTDRDPLIVPHPLSNEFVPFYQQVSRLSVDVQWVIGNWLWKLEALQGENQRDTYTASTGGFEYSFVGIGSSRMDLGIVVEYMQDTRDQRSPHFYQNDIAMGCRLGFNDIGGTELLVGMIDDRDTTARVWAVEMSRRLNSKWSIALEAYAFSRVPAADILYGMRNDDYIWAKMTYYL